MNHLKDARLSEWTLYGSGGISHPAHNHQPERLLAEKAAGAGQADEGSGLHSSDDIHQPLSLCSKV